MSSLLSIDVGKKNIHMAEGSFLKNHVVVEKLGSIPIPEGAFQGESIINLDLLAQAVTSAVQTFRFGSKEAVITFDAYGAVIRDIDLPMAKPKEVAAMIRTEMIQTYHVNPEDIIQFKNIGKFTSENGTILNRYRVTVINPETVESYHSLLSDVKLKPYAMDININALDKLLSGELIINDKLLSESHTMIIDFGGTLTSVYICAKDKPIFFRQLDFGSCEIEKIISEKTFEAEQDIKQMKENGFNFFDSSVEAEEYFTTLRPFLYNLMDEIRKVISFYTSRSNVSNIGQIFLIGGGSNLAGFAEYCESNFGIPTEQIISASNIKTNDSAIPIASYLNAIGALIRY